jgi:Ca2+-binding RTX toxin-like protein
MRRFLPLLIVLAALAAAPSAVASELKVVAGTLTYVDTDPAAANNVTVTLSGSTFTVTDSGRSGRNAIQITSDGTCTGGRGTGTCPATGVGSINIGTGPGNDTIKVVPATPSLLAGGDGNDKLTGGFADDILNGGAGADTLNGGGGRDTADYSDRTNPVTVTLDGKAGDGEAGENDNVGSDVENVSGGAGNDVLTGSDADNVLAGNGGDDTLSGGDGNDNLQGGAGNDTLAGGNGGDSMSGGDGTDRVTYESYNTGVRVTLDGQPNDGVPGENDNVDAEIVTGSPQDDVLIGGPNADDLQGGGGNDRLLGGAGADMLDAGPGDDLIQSLDGTVDTVSCGDGEDGVVSDKPDKRSDCESIKYRVMSASITALHLSKGVVRMPIRCSPAAADGCRGRMAIRYGRNVLGTRSFHLTPGRRWRPQLKISRHGQSLVERRNRIQAVLVVRTRDAAGVSMTTRQTIRIAV